MKVLIIIDMQNGFLTNYQYEGLKEKINDLISSNNYDKHIYTKFVNKNNSMYEKWIGWNGLKDVDSQQIAVSIPYNSIILNKTTYGLSQEQIEIIKGLGVEEVDICGLQSDACVYAISLQLWDNGIFPNILTNYVRTHNKNNMIEIYKHQFGKVDNRD